MSRIFLSHSSANNAQVLALAQWLEREGWSDFFLDIDPSGDLTPGQRWQEALKNAAHRCEVVVVLISPVWVKSNHCVAEFLLAKQLGKRIFGVIVEPTPFGEIPSEMTSEWQLCDLVNGEAREQWTVARDPLVRSTVVSFPVEGLRRLRNGLQKAGLDALSFAWPPGRDPDRAPYRGLKPLDVDDCAVYFGRESATVRGLDELRNMRATGVERLLVVLGASGSGKSSFIRAGVWPRLARDDLHFVPLAVIRPQRAVITGDAGLISALDDGLRRFGIVRTRAAIAASLESAVGLAAVLHEIQQAAARATLQTSDPPSVVLLIDQGEELLATEGQAEATRFVELLASVLRAPPSADAQARASRLLALAVFAIRSDSFTGLQQRVELNTVAMRPFDLRALSAGEFKAVIEGPARRSTAAGRKLNVQPQLTERLLEDSEGADALPLLAFILERLYREFGADGDLRLDEYDRLGGVQGAIVSAIDSALADHRRHPQIPEDQATRETLLRDAFIPWLAVVDPDTGQRRRRVAKWSEIPEPSRPLLERLIEARLIVRDQQHSADVLAEPVVEVAHEALLRRWPLLTAWLDVQAEQLQMLEALRRAASEWHRRGRSRDWLIHLDARLEAAERVGGEPRFRALLGEQGEAYLRACRDLTREKAAEREQQQQRVAEAQARTAEEQRHTARAQRLGRRLIFAVAALVIVAGVVVARQMRAVSLQTSRVLVNEAQRAYGQGMEDRAMRFAILAARSGRLSPTVETAPALLTELLVAGHLRRSIDVGKRVQYLQFSADARYLLVVLAPATLRVMDLRTGRFTPLEVELARYAAFTPDGAFVVAAKGREIQLWNVSTGAAAGVPMTAADAVDRFSLSADGRHVGVITDDGQVEVWDVAKRERRTLVPPAKPFYAAFFIGFSPDSRRLIVQGEEVGAAIVDLNDASPVMRLLPDETTGMAFSNDGRLLATSYRDKSVHFRDPSGAREIRDALHTTTVHDILEFSPDDTRLLLVNTGTGSVSILSLGSEETRFGEQRHVGSEFIPRFMPRGRGVLIADSANSLRVVTPASSEELEKTSLRVDHPLEVTSAAFSPDGRQFATAEQGGLIHLWETAAYEGLPLNAGAVSWSLAAAFSANALRIAVIEESGDPAQRSVSVWDVRTRALLRAGIGRADTITAFDINGDGTRVVTAGDVVNVWDAASGAHVGASLPAKGRPRDVQFSPDGRQVLVAGENDFQTCSIGAAATCKAGFGIPGLQQSHFSPDGTLVAAIGTKGLVVWSGAADRLLLKDEGRVTAYAFSPDGKFIVVGYASGTARQYRLSDSASTQLPWLRGGSEPASAHDETSWIKYSPDGQFLIAGQLGGKLLIWNTLARYDLVSPDTEAHFPGSFTPDGRFFATFDARQRALRFVELGSFRLLGTSIPVQGDFSRMHLSPDVRWLLSRQSDAPPRLIELNQGLFEEREALMSSLCRERLGGSTAVTAYDETAAPILNGRVGEDVCAPPTFKSRWRNFLGSF